MDDQKKEPENPSAETKSDDEVVIDFSKVGKKLKNWFKKEEKVIQKELAPEEPKNEAQKAELSSKEKSDEDISIDMKSVSATLKKHSKWIIPLFCILLAMSVSIYLRTMPLRLPIADSWAENTVENFYTQQIRNQIDQQYPNLPDQNKNTLVDKEWQKARIDNKDQISQQIQQLSQEYKNQFRDNNGTTYLLGIDPYHYYRQTYNVLTYGHPGTEIKDGQYWDSYRLAPIGDLAEWNFHHWFGAFLHRLITIVADVPLMSTFFFVGTIFSALTIIPAFFIGKIITRNNAGGFFTAMFMAASAFFVSRTTGESSDTDVYSVFFPVLIIWLFLEAMEAQKLRNKLILASLAGFAIGVFAFAWTGWWYIATFILITLIVHLVFQLLQHRKELSAFWKSPSLHALLSLTGTYLLSVGIFVIIFSSFAQVKRVLLGPFQFLQLKAVAVTSYWPNIRTTVAELNVTSLSNVIDQLGGKLLLALVMVGILLTFIRKNEHGKREIYLPFLLAMWLTASLFATTKGVRFILQATPVHAIALGACLGIIWHYASLWGSRELKLNVSLTKIVIFLLLAILLIQPVKAGYRQAYQSVPSMNDAWYNTLTKIKNEAPQNIIITSWWDFGHWFKAIADRPVTFDGGNQVPWGAHWVGKSLLTPDEKVTVGIVRVLNCGQNTAFNTLDKIWNDTPKEIKVLNEIVVQNKETALKTLKNYELTTEQIDSVIQYTHCDKPPTDYYITSDDMVGKAGVWGHFGSWDFDKAVMYLNTKSLNRDQAVEYLTNNFKVTEEDAAKLYQEIQSNEADRWIAPWPGYQGNGNCQKQSEKMVVCSLRTPQGDVPVRIDLESKNVTIAISNQQVVQPSSLIYADKEGVQEKKFEGATLGASMILIPNKDEYESVIVDPLQANSVFTKLFFFDGHGLHCFKKFDQVQQFTGGKIITWMMDYDCQQENKVFFLPQEQIRAAHILISTENRAEEEALQLITEIKQNLTAEDFAEYAQKYSDDPGSKENGGDLGWFPKGVMVPAFEQAAFSLKKGEISEPIKTQFGYHIILVMDQKNN